MFLLTLITLALLSIVIAFVPVKAKAWVAVALLSIAAIASTIEAISTLSSSTDVYIMVGQLSLFGAQYIHIDSLAALFLIIIGVGSLATAIYSAGYMKHFFKTHSPIRFSIHYISLVLMAVSMMAVVIMESAMGFLLAWELMTITSFVLILFEADKREIRRAALSYLLIMHIGFVMLLIGFTTLSANGLAADFNSLNSYFSLPEVNPYPLFVAFLIGFGLKAGIFPLHWWLPVAHPAAPSHISALMSGIMIKMGIYGILRIVCAIDNELYTAGVTILSIGIATALWGIIMASAQNNIKRLLAYSSIENIGIIFTGIGLGLLGLHWENVTLAVCGMGGALLHTINHSLFKPMLFMGAGSVQHSAHSLSIDKLGGLTSRMPISATLFLVASAAICALPPLNGFVSEFLIYVGLFDAIAAGGMQAVTALAALLFFALVGGIVVLALTKLYGVVFCGAPRTQRAAEAREVSNEMIIGSAIPLSAILIIGLLPGVIYSVVLPVATNMLGISGAQTTIDQLCSTANNITLVAIIFIILAIAIYLLRSRAIARRNSYEGAVWGCGFTAPTTRMQYTGESFSDELHSLTESVTLDKSTPHKTKNSNIFPSTDHFEVKHKDKIETLFTGWWVELIRLINARIGMLITNKVNHYIFYALGFLVLILILSLLNLI